jgi:hypothetical protein
MAAHEAFDPLWRTGGMTRRDAYQWLADQMGRPIELSHIGLMNATEAWEVMRLCNTYMANRC